MSDENKLDPMPETGTLRFQVGPIGELAEDALYEESLLWNKSITQMARDLIIEALEARKSRRDAGMTYIALKRGKSPDDYRRQVHLERGRS